LTVIQTVGRPTEKSVFISFFLPLLTPVALMKLAVSWAVVQCQ